MKKLISILLIATTIGNLFGQTTPKVSHDFSIETSKRYSAISWFSGGFKCVIGDKMFGLELVKNEIVLRRYSVEGILEQEETVYLKWDKDVELESVLEFEGRYYLFYSQFNKSLKLEQLFFKEIDFKVLSIEQNGHLIASVAGSIVKIAENSYNDYKSILTKGSLSKFQFSKSLDNSKLLVVYRKTSKVKKDSKSKDVFGVLVLDEKIKQIWKHESEMPYTEKMMDNITHKVDDNGNVFMVIRVYNENASKKDIEKKRNHKMRVLKIESKTSKVKVSEINLEGKLINTISLVQDKGGNMNCVGFYSNTGSELSSEGLFIFKLKDGSYTVNEIPLSVANSYVKEEEVIKNAEGRDVGIKNLRIRGLYYQKDGNLIITAEQYLKEVKKGGTVISGSGSGSGGLGSNTGYSGDVSVLYYYNDIVISKINPSGELEWMQKLGKRQKGNMILKSLSFNYLFMQNMHYLIFIDHENNLELASNEEPKGILSPHKGLLSAYKIDDETGEVFKVPLFKSNAFLLNEIEVSLNRVFPSSLMRINEKEIIIEAFIIKAFRRLKYSKNVLIKMKLD